MILEGIVTTCNSDGAPHVSPMGPRVEPGMQRFVLLPFTSSQTFRNLQLHGEGVLHVTDDVELLARAAVGQLDPLPELRPAQAVRGFVLTDACHWYAFRVGEIDAAEQRAAVHCEVLERGVEREFFGFNRGKHAVLEAAILATRLHLLPREQIVHQFKQLKVLVDKTGGPQEQRAFAFLRSHINWNED